MTEKTIDQAIEAYLASVEQARSASTARTYRNALRLFCAVLEEYGLDPQNSPTNRLKEESIVGLLTYLKDFSAATERLYLQAVKGFYIYLDAERLADINLSRLNLLIRQRARRVGIRLPQFPREDIERLIQHITAQAVNLSDNLSLHERLRSLRDWAFLITLADTGLRVHEACALRRGDLDWNEGRAVIIGKGNKQAIVRFSSRSLRALQEYLAARAELDGASGKPLASLPLFARHDKGAGRKIKPITTATGRNIVSERVRQALGAEAVGRITPHSFRHYFVTTVLRASGNLKLAQALARHANIQVTQRYAHLSDDELDQKYYEIFEQT